MPVDHALLDGWFVVHVVDRDEHGRPTRVVVVDVEPDTYIGQVKEFGEAEEYQVTLRFADVVWLGVEPSVIVRPDGGRS